MCIRDSIHSLVQFPVTRMNLINPYVSPRFELTYDGVLCSYPIAQALPGRKTATVVYKDMFSVIKDVRQVRRVASTNSNLYDGQLKILSCNICCLVTKLKFFVLCKPHMSCKNLLFSKSLFQFIHCLPAVRNPRVTRV